MTERSMPKELVALMPEDVLVDAVYHLNLGMDCSTSVTNYEESLEALVEGLLALGWQIEPRFDKRELPIRKVATLQEIEDSIREDSVGPSGD